MKRLVTVILAALAFSNIAVAQSNSDTVQAESFEFLTKFSPL